MTVSKEGHGIKRMKSSLSRKMLFMILVMALLLSLMIVLPLIAVRGKWNRLIPLIDDP